MILHLVFDDKFVDYAIRQFLPSGCSEFITVVDDPDQGFKHIKQADKVRALRDKSDDYYTLLNNLADYKAIILHGFYTPWQVDIVYHTPANVKVCWAFWGGDMYQRPDICDLYLSKGSHCIQKLREMVKGKKQQGYIVPFDVYSRVDYLLDDSFENYEDVKRYIHKPDLKFLWYTYYSVEETVGDSLIQSQVSGPNLMVGHTACIRTNHIDGFIAVKKLNLKGHSVVSALSYGESWYRSLMIKVGRILFGKRFKPLLSFLPLEQYNKILCSCPIEVMPAYKPEGMGNCLTALWLGAKVYMYERNLKYQYFKRLGLSVFSIEKDLVRSNSDWDRPLSLAEVEHNRKILLDQYGKAAMAKRINSTVSTLES
jgi:hypothetical protein